ncbi:hypothetical protein DID88_007861 [Monilinia fructigena]|uniref:CS domain-containing protein n=1 Tax=Monilinia fructigena TaxID=38457 RepID=A0A395J404_9HELO|nr:hypothetical protein DID88_007861 [Monilinia fructigena]
MSETTATPEVLWAQRSNKTEAEKEFHLLNHQCSRCQRAKDRTQRAYALTLEFYAEIDESASKYNHTQKSTQFVLRKKELKEEFWPRLLKDSKKVHFLKTDFDKWVDEDEQDEAPEEDLSQMGGMGGMPGMGDMMGGAGGDFGGGEEDEGEDEEDDEEMPALEGEEEAAEEPKAKITEVA